MAVLEDFEFDPEYVPGFKLSLHIFQILCAFVVFCLEIAVFLADGAAIVGNNGWTFAVVFLSIPAWVYLIMTPRFDRTRRFAEPHALLTIDALFVVIWLSAFATQAAYNTANLCGSACSESKAIVALGVFNTLFFGATTFLSSYSLKYYQLNGTLPGYDKQRVSGSGNNIDPDKAAFSMAPQDEEAYAPVQRDEHDEHDDDDHNDSHGYDDPNRYGSLPPRVGSPYEETEYSRPAQTVYAPPTAQDAYEDDRPVQFPAGNYDRDL